MPNVTESQFANSMAIISEEFQNRSILLKGEGPPAMVAPRFAQYKDTLTGDTYENRTDLVADWHLVVTGGSVTTVAGAVFITDITPQDSADNVGGKVTSSDGKVLDSCVTDTELITVQVVSSIGQTNYKPVITVQGEAVSLTEDPNKALWTGSIDINRSGAETITAAHEDGATHSCTITLDAGPEVTTATFTGGYPAGQTELKSGDRFDIAVVTDTPMTRIEVDAFGAAQAHTLDFTASDSHTVTITVADQGNTAALFGARLRCMNANGSYGAWFQTDSAGSVDGVNVVNLNNLHPEITFTGTTYPNLQSALKDAETATIDHEVSNFDSIQYTTSGDELVIPNPTEFEGSKVVTRNAGDYNVSTDNFIVTAKRNANAAETALGVVVAIAHRAPQVSIAEPATRLRSGGNHGTAAQNHTITLTSDQQLYEAPTIGAPAGSLQGVMVDSGNMTAFTQTLLVHDNDTKGVHTFTLTAATNRAGIVITAFTGEANYEIGGFVSRTISIPAFEYVVDLEVNVSDTSKLAALDKDLLPMTYANDFADVVKQFTIVVPDGGGGYNLDANGNLFHWNDSQGISNNSTGLATITIEETV